MPISDAEREALIKERVAYHNYNFANDLTFAVHRLGEVELELAEARAEIARLRAPPGESAIEILRSARAAAIREWDGRGGPDIEYELREERHLLRSIERAEQNARRTAAALARGEALGLNYRHWPWYGAGNDSNGSERVKFCDALADAILAEASAPTEASET